MATQQELVLITGSSGLIGTSAAQKFAESFKVIGLNRDVPAAPVPSVEFIHLDISSDESVHTALAGIRAQYGRRIAAVIHLAAYYDFYGEPSPHYEEITVRGTARLLCGLQDFQVGQFIFASTMLVHAPCEPGQRIDEDWPLDPKWNYPQSKYAAEGLIRAGRGTTPVVLLRMAGVYDDTCHAPLLAYRIRRIYERWLLSSVFPGDSTHGQPYLHVDDLVQALLLLVKHRTQLPPELTLLLGEPDTLSYDQLQYKLARLIHDEDWDTREIPKALAKTGAWVDDVMPAGEEPYIKPWMIDFVDDHYVLDITRAHTLLGWQPKRTLLGTLPKIVEALKADPLGWYRSNKLTAPDWLKQTEGRYDRRQSNHTKQQADAETLNP